MRKSLFYFELHIIKICIVLFCSIEAIQAQNNIILKNNDTYFNGSSKFLRDKKLDKDPKIRELLLKGLGHSNQDSAFFLKSLNHVNDLKTLYFFT